jgi:hypothetical protein
MRWARDHLGCVSSRGTARDAGARAAMHDWECGYAEPLSEAELDWHRVPRRWRRVLLAAWSRQWDRCLSRALGRR